MKNKQQRREEAEDRQEMYDALTTNEKLTAIKNRTGKSAKETKKLKGEQQRDNARSKSIQRTDERG